MYVGYNDFASRRFGYGKGSKKTHKGECPLRDLATAWELTSFRISVAHFSKCWLFSAWKIRSTHELRSVRLGDWNSRSACQSHRRYFSPWQTVPLPSMELKSVTVITKYILFDSDNCRLFAQIIPLITWLNSALFRSLTISSCDGTEKLPCRCSLNINPVTCHFLIELFVYWW